MTDTAVKENITQAIDLKKLQMIELDILQELDRICEKHNITYHLFGGTLIGAIRHKGFIPWDDDIDICMRREDYNEFISICKRELSNSYFLQNYKSDPNFFHSFVRIRKNGTVVMQRQYKDIDMHHGVFIDVFPFDNIPDSSIRKKIQYSLIRGNRIIKNFKIKKKANQRNLKSIVKKFVSLVVKPIPLRYFNSVETYLATYYNKRVTNSSTLMVEAIQINHNRCMVDNSLFYEVEELEFEEHMFIGPKYYDKILTNMYGDYMKLPKESERQPHHNIVDFQY